MGTMEHRISGCHGFIVIPDKETIRVANDLVQEMAPGAQNKMGELVHLSLYYAMLELASPELIGAILRILRNMLDGTELLLGPVEVYANHYLSWNLEVNQPDLDKAHYTSLASLDLHRADKFSTLQINEFQGLTDREKTNIAQYGFPLVLNQFKQQLTLASDPKSLELRPTTVRHVGRVADVHFVRFGPWECIETVLSSPSAKD